MTIECKTMDQIMILNFTAEILRLKNPEDKEVKKQVRIMEKAIKDLRKIQLEEEQKHLIVN